MAVMVKEYAPRTRMEDEIERTREHMSQMAGRLGVLHPDVVRCSEVLDELLLQYYAIMWKTAK